MKKLKFESPTGEEIQCHIKFEHFLCIETNFDTFRNLRFANSIYLSAHVADWSSVRSFEKQNGGYYIFRLATSYDKEALFDDVQTCFNSHF